MAAKRWVVFDLGETLLDETAGWGTWADYFGVPRLTFFAALGAVIADRRPHTDVFELFRPGFELAELERLKSAAGLGWIPSDLDLYDDAVPTLQTIRANGYRLAIMANQPAAAATFMASLPVDRVATSAQWGLFKPDPAFFRRVVSELGTEASAIAYIGDRVDNDVIPARAAGMYAVHLRRGPWGVIQSAWPDAERANLRISTLAELPAALHEWV